jgi:hypothetical protein
MPLIYSVEARETGSNFSARSRYLLDPLPAGVPLVSDIVITAPADPGSTIRAAEPNALGKLVLPGGTSVGLFAELDRLEGDENGIRRANLEFEILDATEPSLLGRLGRFVGRILGRSGAGAPKLAWSEQFALDEPALVSTTVDLRNVSAGLKLLRLTVTDPVAGTRTVRDRVILLR